MRGLEIEALLMITGLSYNIQEKYIAQTSKHYHVTKRDESNKTITVTLGLDMQLRSSRIRLLITLLNI